MRTAINSTIPRHGQGTLDRFLDSLPSCGDDLESNPENRFPYLPTVTPAVERKASLTLVAFMSSSTSRVRTVVCPGVLRIGSVARSDESRLALYGAAGST